MTSMFTPEPQPYPAPKVFIAAVGEAMTEMCGEIADGLVAHAFTTSRYLDDVKMPAVQRGMRRCGRDRRTFEVACPVFVVTGDDDAELTAAANVVRKQLAFYGSTPHTARCLSYTGGATWRLSYIGCHCKVSGTPWAR